MKVFEVHNAVARTIGDPVECTGSLLEDGVRYSAALRAQYCTHAMNDIVLKVIRQTSGLPHKVQSEVLERLFPAMVKVRTGAFPLADPTMAFLLSAYYTLGGESKTLPIVKSAHAVQTAYSRASLQPSDPFIVYRGNSFIVAGGRNEAMGSAIMTGFILQRPPDIEWMADVANADEEVDFEGMWMPEVHRRVALLAQLDSGELGTAHQAFPFLTLFQGELSS